MKLDKAVVAMLESAILKTWSQIGYDALQAIEEAGERMDNETAMEFCIDANRLLLNGGDKVADETVRDLCKEHGYAKVLKFLSKHIKLA